MLISYRFKSNSFCFEYEDWKYVVVFTDKGAKFHDEEMKTVPAPEDKVISRLKSMLPHYPWEVKNEA